MTIGWQEGAVQSRITDLKVAALETGRERLIAICTPLSTVCIVGAFFVNGAKSWFTQAFPEFWLYFLGALFILVTLYLPDGIVGGVKKLLNKNAEVKA